MTSQDAPANPSNPADQGVPEDNFGNPLARLVNWLRDTDAQLVMLKSGERTLLLEHMATLQADRESVSSQLWDCMYERDGWKDRAERAERILAALREPSVGAVDAAWAVYQAHTWWDERDDMARAIRAAVAAAEQVERDRAERIIAEVGRE